MDFAVDQMLGNHSSRVTFVFNLCHPYYKCGFIEFLISGISYFILAGVCIFLLLYQKASPKCTFDLMSNFWISMAFWTSYHGLFQIIYVNWDAQSYYAFYVCLDYLFFLIPSCIFIYIISETLFVYRNPGRLIVTFSRLLFGLFFFIFLLLGIIAAAYQKIDETSKTKFDFFYLWGSCVDLLLLVFVSIPSLKLIRAITMPVIQPEDVKCVRVSKIGLIFLDLIFITRFIFNILSYCGENYFSNYLTEKINEKKQTDEFLQFEERYSYWLFDMIFNFGTSIILISGIYVLRRHDLTFVEDPFYTNEKTETETT